MGFKVNSTDFEVRLLISVRMNIILPSFFLPFALDGWCYFEMKDNHRTTSDYMAVFTSMRTQTIILFHYTDSSLL